jgi:hypothetical protein
MPDIYKVAAKLVDLELRDALPHLNEDELLNHAIYRLENLAGQHLLVRRDGYAHHAIAISPTEILHYNGRPGRGRGARVKKGTLYDLLWGSREGGFRIRQYRKRKYLPVETIKRAYRRKGEKDYDLVTNNCETFCSWAVAGRHASKQVAERMGVLRYPVNAFLDVRRKAFGKKAQLLSRCPRHEDVPFHRWEPS